MFTALEILGQFEKLWMITQLLQNVYSFERLGLSATQESLDFWRGNEKTIKRKLEVRQSTKYNLFILDRDYEGIN